MAVVYEELEGSPVVGAGTNYSGAKEVRTFVCAWEDRIDVLRHLVETPSPNTGMYPTNFDITPLHDGRSYSRITGSSPIQYEKAVIKIEYGFRVSDADMNNFFNVTETLEGETQYVRIDSGSVVYEDGTTVDAGDDITYPVVVIRWTKKFTSPLPLSGLNLTIVNKINSNFVFSNKYDVVFPPYTLLCKTVTLNASSPPWLNVWHSYRVECLVNFNQWGRWVDKHGNPKRLRSKRTGYFISPYQIAYFPL